jgi:two-component system sensor histidine kinase QseC
MIKIKSIRNRILVWVFLLFLVIWAGISYSTYYISSHEVEELFDSELAQSAGVLLQISANFDPDASNLEPTLYKDVYGHRYEKKISFQIFQNKKLLLQSANAPPMIMSNQAGFSNQTINNSLWRVFRFNDVEHNRVIITAENLDVRQELVNEITQDSLYPLTFMIPILLLMIWVGIDRGLQPIKKLAKQIAQRSPDNLEPVHVNFSVPNEILPLFTGLNDLLTKLKKAFERERRFTSDAAHELQTPLASIKTQTQVALRAQNREEQEHALKKATEGIDRASHMVQQLLSLARLEPIDNLSEVSSIDLCQLTRNLLGELDMEAHRKNIELSLDECGPVLIQGNKAAIEIMIRNLLSNAIRYTPDSGKVSTGITTTKESIRLRVTDSGPGIPEQDRERVFERFYRGEDNQHIIGSGLGLSIAKRIADLHHASITLGSPESGTGLNVTIEFKTG